MPRPRRRAASQDSLPLVDDVLAEVRRVDAIARNAEAVKKRGAGQKAGVLFREVPSTRLVQVDRDAVEGTTVAGAIVKVTAELRPSERESFDAAGVRADLLGRGAIAVIVAPVVVPEAPSTEAKEEVARSVGPEEAIGAWFDGLAAARPEDVEAARTLVLHMLGQEEAR